MFKAKRQWHRSSDAIHIDWESFYIEIKMRSLRGHLTESFEVNTSANNGFTNRSNAEQEYKTAKEVLQRLINQL